ncbi:S-adenosyl-L-methionine-dependent methyltransferase [Dioszegia hungarica]|uniref:sphingolipid C(9)-methyltransferase n=1 Tax=Dioszegia hungarica TaxID=4972 RepID=A0AA38H235_9TREE|nr:S-adenosyl-L-methionine-dependent methyltransferase [Dioszegia hungarica]KAI9632718.1 S-adenosyl-L-methionine-dependent methyltransferase [Dioszegia hungarica]
MADVQKPSSGQPNGDAPQKTFRVTNSPAIANAPLPAEGSASFNNYHLAGSVFAVTYLFQRIFLPFAKSWTTFFVLLVLLFLPVTVAYWTLSSKFGKRVNEKVPFPNRPQGDYIEIKSGDMDKWRGKKIPMQIFHDAYFEGKFEFKGDVLDVMEYRHDWASFEFTPALFKYVFVNLIPDVLLHSRTQDEEQVRDHYDRGNDFYSWFLGPRMIYTSGVITDITRQETLEELQDNKLTMVCEKLNLKKGDRMLDIGCGWGTLATFAAKNYGADVTGVTLAREQTAFGNARLRENNIPESQGRINCMDYRDIPANKGSFDAISCLEMAEHVGIRHYPKFLREVYELLDDDGTLVFQVAGIRTNWQYEDLIWGLFMNKYVFPGADASLPLGWVIKQLEAANFEIKSVDVLGVHYSATLHRWYLNWVSNKDKVVEKYGIRWYRIWVYFLAYSVIISRQGSASVFQITAHKNLNGYHRVEGIPSHSSIHAPIKTKISPAVSHASMWPGHKELRA